MSTYDSTKLELEKMMNGGHTVADLLGMIAHICEDKREWLLSGENGHAPDKPYAAAYLRAARVLTGACKLLARSERIRIHQV